MTISIIISSSIIIIIIIIIIINTVTMGTMATKFFIFYRWPLDPQTINAMYSFNENQMSTYIPYVLVITMEACEVLFVSC